MTSCDSDDGGTSLIDFSASFANEATSLSGEESTKTITIGFSRAATETGTLTIDYSGDNAEYGTDFTTTPEGQSGVLSLSVAEGETSVSFELNKLVDLIEGTSASVTFTLVGVEQCRLGHRQSGIHRSKFYPRSSHEWYDRPRSGRPQRA